MPGDITVLAGNGKSGRRVSAAVRVAGHPVRVAGRNGPVRFDWHEPDTWPGVIEGVDALYVVVPDTDSDAVETFLDAALAAGIQRFVMLSGRKLEQLHGHFGASMISGERAVARTGRATILRCANFFQNFTEELWEPGIRAGRLTLPALHVYDCFVDLGDVAAVAARTLTQEGHEGTTYELTGPAPLDFEHAVDVLAAATGRDIVFQPIPSDEYAVELRSGGLDEAAVQGLVGLFRVMSHGYFASASDDVERILGRPARSFQEWAVEQAAIAAWG